MQYVVKLEIEPKVSLVILLGKMEDDDYSAFHSELNDLLEKDHSLVFDCGALTDINTPGIQAISALSSKAKKFSNISAFFGLGNKVRKILEDANILDELIVTSNNFEAMKIAKKLQPQKEELRKVAFGREQNIPKSEQKNDTAEPPPQKETPAQTPAEESSFYQHIKAQAEEALRWEHLLDEKLSNEGSLSERSPLTENKTPDTTPTLPTTVGEGVTPYEKEMLFDTEPVTPTMPTPPIATNAPQKQANTIPERGVTLAEKDDLFADTTSAKKTERPQRIPTPPAPQRQRRSTPTPPAPKQSLLVPFLLSLVLMVGVLNIFKEPLQHSLFSPETLDTIAQEKALKHIISDDIEILPESIFDDAIMPDDTTATIPLVTETTPLVDEPPSDADLLALLSSIKLPARTSTSAIITPTSATVPLPTKITDAGEIQNTTVDETSIEQIQALPEIIPEIKIEEKTEKPRTTDEGDAPTSHATAVNEAASIEIEPPLKQPLTTQPVETPAEFDPGLIE